ncbi:MAG TPA: hypothetical protein VEY09_07080 [Pyrinomonadaceae bacterium]|nr:hypothetical protein [Pyrinomonadaceae bacterium]
MRVSVERLPDSLAVAFSAAAGEPLPELVASFKRAVMPHARRYDPAARRWTVRLGHHAWVLLWLAGARREFGVEVFDESVMPRPPRRPPSPATRPAANHP